MIPRLILLMCLLLGSSSTFSAVQTNSGIVVDMHTYSTFGDGDVIFNMPAMPSGCHGFWLRKADPGFQGYLSFLLSAFHAGTTVLVAAHDNDLWSGSSSPYCRVDWIRLTK